MVKDGQYREQWRFAKMEVPATANHLAGAVVSSLNGAALCGGPVEVEEVVVSAALSPQGDGGIGASTDFWKSPLVERPQA